MNDPDQSSRLKPGDWREHQPFFGIGLRILIALASLVIVIAGLRASTQLVVPFLLAIFLAILSGPPLAWLRRRGLSRPVSLLIVLTALILGTTGFGILTAGTINRFVGEWPVHYEPRARQLVADWNHWLEAKVQSHSWLEHFRIDEAGGLWGTGFDPGQSMKTFVDAMRTAGSLLSEMLLVIVTAVFLVAEASHLPEKLRRMTPAAESRFADLSRIASQVNRYMAIKTWISLLTGALIAVGLKVIGVEFAILWGFFAFMFNYVPNIGSIIASVPPVALSLFQPDGGTTLFVESLLLVTAVNVVIGTYLEPLWMGEGLGLSTLMVFLSLVFWGWVLGPVGMLISVPLTMAVKIALESSADTRWIAILMGGSDPASADQPVGRS